MIRHGVKGIQLNDARGLQLLVVVKPIADHKKYGRAGFVLSVRKKFEADSDRCSSREAALLLIKLSLPWMLLWCENEYEGEVFHVNLVRHVSLTKCCNL